MAKGTDQMELVKAESVFFYEKPILVAIYGKPLFQL